VKRTDSGLITTTWSGGILPGQWASAYGTWGVPRVAQPTEPPGLEGAWNSASWVGIDGYQSDDVLQAGIQQQVLVSGRIVYVAWYEWYAAPQPDSPPYIYETTIKDFLVRPGHSISCVVQYTNNRTAGYLFLGNNTTGGHFNITLQPPPGVTLSGNCIEWIMEAPDGGYPTSALPAFTPVNFTRASGTSSDGRTQGNPQDGGYAYVVYGGQTLTAVTLASDAVSIQYTGTPNFSWSAGDPFGQEWGSFSGASLIQSNFGNNLEVVGVAGSQLIHFYRDSTNQQWSAGDVIALGFSGAPGFIQSRNGTKGNFEVVAPVLGGGLQYYWRNNDQPAYPWTAGGTFGQRLGSFSGASLIQSNFGNNLEVVGVAGSQLIHFYRDSTSQQWSAGAAFASGVSGAPGFIQGHGGVRGNFEVVAPLSGGGLQHYWRNNDQEGYPWTASASFGQGFGSFSGACLIESSFGNLEVVGVAGGQLIHFYRDNTSPQWSAGDVIDTGASGAPGFIQSNAGIPGNFEVVTPLGPGGLQHYWRNNTP
jgi:hypothetical protein